MIKVNKDTVSNYLNFYRQLVADDLTQQQLMVGGPGMIVEIDESKFGKRKFNRGHHVEGVWVVGGVERTPQRRIFAVKVDARDSNTLKSIIQAYVLPRSIIHTDGWAGYNGIPTWGDYQHFTVVHEHNFVEPDGTHTNTIEGTWAGIKRNIPVQNRTYWAIEGHLYEFIWRRAHHNDLWESLLRAFHNVSYPTGGIDY
jgi:transposase-like protein